MSNNRIVITGGPGAGKSTLIQALAPVEDRVAFVLDHLD